MRACMSGDTSIRVSIMGGASSLEMTMATACVKSMSIPWKGSGRSCGVGCARIGAFPKRNSRCTWVSSSSCTTCASGVKRCCLRSLSCWSNKTLESNKSDYRKATAVPQSLQGRCEGKTERTPLALARGFDPDASAMHLDDALDQGQTDARALALRLQPLEEAKNLRLILRRNPHT